jgi:hypothetical protein
VSSAGETAGRDLEIPAPPRRRIYLRIEELPDDQSPPNPLGRRVLLARPSYAVIRIAQRAQDVDATAPGSPDHMDAVYDLAAALMPELSRADVERVSVETVLHIFGVFSASIDDLERLAKNGAAPLAKAEKGSSSEIPSPTSTRGSARRSRSGR